MGGLTHSDRFTDGSKVGVVWANPPPGVAAAGFEAQTSADCGAGVAPFLWANDLLFARATHCPSCRTTAVPIHLGRVARNDAFDTCCGGRCCDCRPCVPLPPLQVSSSVRCCAGALRTPPAIRSGSRGPLSESDDRIPLSTARLGPCAPLAYSVTSSSVAPSPPTPFSSFMPPRAAMHCVHWCKLD